MSDSPFEKFDDNPFADAAVVNASEFNDSSSAPSSSATKPTSTASSTKKGGFFSGIGSAAKKAGFQSFQNDDDEGHDSAPAADDEKLFQGTSSSSGGDKKSAPPPAYSAGAQTYNPYDDAGGASSAQDEALRKKEAELRRKEEELNMKMRMQAEQQAQIQQQQASLGPKAPNWPPFPPFMRKFCACKPWIYHSIPDEIPPEHQKHLRLIYYSWWLLVVCYMFNILGTMCVLIAGQGGKDFGFAIMYLPIISALSFYLWYRPVYSAYMKDKSFYFMMYLFFGGWNIAFEIYLIIGLPDNGTCGFINTINLFGKAFIGEGIICLLGLILWIFAACVHTWQWRLVYRDFRFRGHTFAEARNQAFSSAAKSAAQSDVGREAISSAVTGAVKGAVSGDQRA